MTYSNEGLEKVEEYHKENGTSLVQYSAVNSYLCSILKIHRQQIDAGANNISKERVFLFII